MFTVFAKRIFVSQSASPCNAATVCFSYRLNSRLNDVVESGGSLLPISLRRCILETKRRNLTAASSLLCYEHSIWTGDGP